MTSWTPPSHLFLGLTQCSSPGETSDLLGTTTLDIKKEHEVLSTPGSQAEFSSVNQFEDKYRLITADSDV